MLTPSVADHIRVVADPNNKGCGERLYALRRDSSLANDEGARNFLKAVKESDHETVRKMLRGEGKKRSRDAPSEERHEQYTIKPRPELLLMLVDGRPLNALDGRRMWKWSVFSEAVRVMPSDADGAISPALLTLNELLKLAGETYLELEHDQMRKSDSETTAMHEAVDKGNVQAIAALFHYVNTLVQRRPHLVSKYDGKLGLWAESRSGWLPIHNACIRGHAAYSMGIANYIPGLIKLMDDQLDIMKEAHQKVQSAAAGAAGSSSEHNQQQTSLALPASAKAALGKLRIDSEGKEVIGPKGFNEKKNVDVEHLGVHVRELPLAVAVGV